MDENGTGGGNNASLGDQVKQQGQQAVQQGQQIAGSVVGKAADQVKGQLSTQKDNLAGSVESVAKVLQQASGTLKDQGQPAFAEYGDKAAAQVTKVSDYLKQKDLTEIVSDVSDFGRSNPAVFLGIAVTLGAVAARFLKSSGSAVASAPTTATVPTPPASSSIPADSSSGGYYSNAPASPTSHAVPPATGAGGGPALHGVDVGDEDEFAPTESGLDYIEVADATSARMSNDL